MSMSYSRFYLFTIVLVIFLTKDTYAKNENKLSESINLIQATSEQEKMKSVTTQMNLNDKLQSANSKSLPLSQQQKTMKINTDLIVNGNIHSGKVVTEKLTVNTKGSIQGLLKANEITSDTVITQTTLVNSIISPNGIIVIEGDVIISNDSDDDEEEETAIAEPLKQSININMEGASYSIDNIKQFSITHHDDFDSSDSIKGWSVEKTSQCSEGGNVFLGGHCNLSFEEARKTYELPDHETLRITASFHMFDDWKGEIGYMKINDEIVWSREGRNNEGDETAMNYCGSESNDPAFNLGIDITIPHNEKKVEITFGSTLEGDPCNASFGVDDVMLYVK